MGMNVDEDFGPDRGMDFETDDEENQASRVCDNDDNDDDEDEDGAVSESTVPSRNESNNCIDPNSNPTWPQTYRQSMDMLSVSMTPPSVSFLGGSSLTIISNSFLSSAYKRPQPYVSDVSLNKPLISATSADKEEVPTSTLPHSKLSETSTLKLSHIGLPEPRQCSFAQSLLNVVNVLCGIGLLTIPYALKEGGWWTLVLLLIMGVISCYTGILLKKCLDTSPGLKTYPDIGQAAFGVSGRIFIAIILYLELYSSCVEFLIMMSDNLSTLFPNVHMDLAGIDLNSHQIFALTSTLLILPTVWLRNLSLLSYISVGGVVASLLVTFCLFWVGVVDEVGFHPSGTAFELGNLPVTLGLYGFCFGGHSVFPNIYSSMEKPSQYPSVLIISFVASMFLYAGVGVFGFLVFGNLTQSQFTLNMPPKFVASKIAVWTTVLNPITKYALTITPIAASVEELLPSAQLRSSHGISILIRTVLVISTLVVALTVPYFDAVMALIGSLLVMLVALVIPCVCYLSILRGRLTKLQIAACIFVIVVGSISSFLGTYSAIQSILDKMG